MKEMKERKKMEERKKMMEVIIPTSFLAFSNTNKKLKHIKQIPNPIRRGLGYFVLGSEKVLLLPFCIAGDVFWLSLLLISGLIQAPFYGLFFGLVYAVKGINRWIDRFDETPVANAAVLTTENQSKTDIIEKNATSSSSHDSSRESSYSSDAKILAKLLEVDSVVKMIGNCTEYTQNYLASFNNTKPYSQQIAQLNLSKKQSLKLEAYQDPITNEYINIPVRLNEQLYDFQTLINCYQKNKRDPLNNISFELSNITPARDVNESIKKLIVSFEKQNNKSPKEAAVSEMHLDQPIETSPSCS